MPKRQARHKLWSEDQTTTWENRGVLLLNASEEPLRVIPWQRAVKLLYDGKAFAPFNYDHHFDIGIKNNRKFELPSALILSEYINVPYSAVMPSRKNIFRRDDWICQYTGQKLDFKTATIDHVIPTARGGLNTFDNMVCCHVVVNTTKGNRTPKEAGLELLRKPFRPTRQELTLSTFSLDQRRRWSRWLNEQHFMDMLGDSKQA